MDIFEILYEQATFNPLYDERERAQRGCVNWSEISQWIITGTRMYVLTVLYDFSQDAMTFLKITSNQALNKDLVQIV